MTNFDNVSNMDNIGYTSETHHKDIELEDGKKYYYAVTAVDVFENEDHHVQTRFGIVSDITPPEIYVSSVGYRVAGKVILSATLIDRGVGLSSCEMCVYMDDEDCIWNGATDDFEVGDNNGTCWALWDTEDIEKGTYHYNFKATDKDDNTRVGYEKSTKVINVSGARKFTLDLDEGWNLISIPLIPKDQSTESILEEIKDDYEKIYYYDSETQIWEVFNPIKETLSQPNNLLQLNIGKAYWISMKKTRSLDILGYEIANYSMSLNEGWNFIGSPYIFPIEVINATSSIVDNYYRIYSYDTKAERWIFYSPYSTSDVTISEIKPGIGYLIDVKTPIRWEP